MRVLEYSDLDTSRVRAQYEKVRRQLEADDLRSAELKKLSHGELFRAKLSDANRLILRIVHHRGERVALALEVVEQHAYDRSRFLRGVAVDESKIPDLDSRLVEPEALPELRYLNPGSARFHLLDKVLSFDEAQEGVLRLPPPLILIGSAGSGKTALALEKLKLAHGDVLYVTLSRFLAEHAAALYHANGFAREKQNPEFLSLGELVETVRVPTGREVTFAGFRGFVARHRQAHRRIADPHKLFEEFRGVLTGPDIDTPWLGREAYESLGVKRSLFLDEERPEVYDLFEKYLAWLRDESLFDSNVVAQSMLGSMPERFDFVVVDEAQDLTNIQLGLILRTLRRAGHFLLCGDSNQVVHPNFFSWSNVKTLFFEHEELAPRRQVAFLRANYRNAVEVTALANRLLKIKLVRFGSVDRESHYLVEALPSNRGQVELVEDDDAAVREIDKRTFRSVRFAVIVLREEEKAEAARRFRTPLLFSVQEAKGLEYENVILWGFVSCARGDFASIAEGVAPEELAADIEYCRAKDKRDKSVERYKFFVNGLYVAITRAVKRLIVVEKDVSHPLLGLLGLEVAGRAEVTAQESSVEEWQAEARRLELQGKQEQADAIRSGVLHQQEVPWQILDRERLRDVAKRALDPACISGKLRRQLGEYAAVYDDPDIAGALVSLGEAAEKASVLVPGPGRKHRALFESRNLREVLDLVDQYGVDHRSPFNFTPLMLAAEAGNEDLCRALVKRGADPTLTDNVGRTALMIVLDRAKDPIAQIIRNKLPGLWRVLAPESMSLRVEGRLIKLDSHTIEFVLFHLVFVVLRRHLLSQPLRRYLSGLRSGDVLRAALSLPADVLYEERRTKAYMNGVLARNEAYRDYPYNRSIFRRTWHGEYILNPLLSIGDVPVYDAMGLSFMGSLGLRLHGKAAAFVEEVRRVTPVEES